MTSNPHPGHGLWVERGADGGHLPHALMLNGFHCKSLAVVEADAIEAQINPLPDGVYRRGDEFRLASMFPVADGWTRVAALERRRDAMAITTIIRRVPAEPPAPPTEDVPLHELCGRRLPGCDWEVRRFGVGELGASAYDHPVGVVHCAAIDFTLNPDGTVTVQAQGVES